MSCPCSGELANIYAAIGNLESEFLKYTIVSNPNLHTHKIYSNG